MSFGILIFLIGLLSPNFKPQWREIKKSSGQLAAAILNNNINTEINATNFTKLAQNDVGIDKNQKDQVNFLILGVAGDGYDAPYLTDTILLAHWLMSQNKIFLFSLPRDLLVKIPGQDSWTKLNALYAFTRQNKGQEFDLIKQKVENISELPISHVVMVDLETVKNLVDTLGGVNVMVKKDLIDPAFPGPNHSYEIFSIKAGWRYLDGETALKFIRSRHESGGDFSRISRQQDVLQALKQKILQLSFWDFPTFIKIFNTVANRIKTDLDLWQIKDYWDKVKNIPGENIIKTEIDDPALVTTDQTFLGGVNASIVKPKAGLENYEDIKNYIAKIISQ